MGVETITKATDSFTRKQRRCLDDIEAPNLFSGAPRVKFALVATPREGHAFGAGEAYRLQRDGSAILVVRGVTAVGDIDNPPPSVLDTMRGACASGLGRVAAIFSMTGKAELFLESP